jgi:hypothetical protein
MAVAAPGEEPQTAVVPGSTRQRLIIQPSALLAAITVNTTPRNSGHWFRKAPTISDEIARAIRQPTIACAPR